jgi:hypothetical protein
VASGPRLSPAAGKQQLHKVKVIEYELRFRFRFRFRYVLHPFAAKYSHWMWH